MKKRTKIYLILLLLAIGLELIIFAPKDLFDQGGHESVADKSEVLERAHEKSPSGADQFMSGVHLTGTRQEVQEWELWSEKASGFKDKNAWSLQVVKSIFFADKGVTFKVTGQTGEVNLDTKDLGIEGKVKTVSSNGYVLRTKVVKYNSKNKKLVSPHRVEVVGPPEPNGDRLALEGAKMSADLADSYMWIEGGVVARKTVEMGRRVIIRSQSARLSGRDNSVFFKGKVVMDMDNMRVAGPKAVFQYSPDGKTVESVLVDGGVKVSDSDKWATANNVKVNFKKDMFIFQGNPRVVQNNDELRGNKIVFTKGGKRVQVFKARAKVGKGNVEKLN